MRQSYPVDLDEGMDMADDYGNEIAEQIGYYDEDDELGGSGDTSTSPATIAQQNAAAIFHARQQE